MKCKIKIVIINDITKRSICSLLYKVLEKKCQVAFQLLLKKFIIKEDLTSRVT